ncbi:ribonuclease III [Curvibacter sp. CHRR-16]|uniref:ribonuclease III n=1 Tax=Curvibacter sp. CHRR-16 TaxID=2835872 RepID=UPI001BDA9FB2|nr:ribonuclease III [Curvibacter sp. CHRR-16]
MSSDGLASLQHRLQHSFRKPELLQRALTHRSFSSDHYERLEFLGDSVLGLVMSDMLYQQLQQLPEGDLSRVRANLVREETLHKLALGLELPTLLRLGEGEMRSGGARRASILADALEAIIGAVYVDAGFDAAHAVVKHLFAKVEFTTSMTARDKDPKTALQEWLQGRKYRLPVYTIVATTGLAHQQNFDVECVVPDLRLTERGLGASRRAAEQAAAAAMLQTIQARNKT